MNHSFEMIFQDYRYQLLNNIQLNVEYHCDQIRITVQWSSGEQRWSISYIDEECSLPNDPPRYYLCSSSSSSNASFYSYWFLLDRSLFRRLFSHLITDEEHFVLLLCLSDGRILALPQSPSSTFDSQSIVWYSSSSSHALQLLALHHDLNRNLLDAVLASNDRPSTICSKIVANHLIIAEPMGSVVMINSTNLRRILLDHFIKSICLHSNHFLYITRTELRSIPIGSLLKLSNEEILSQSKILRFGQMKNLFLDGQEVIVYYENETFERLTNLYGRSIQSNLRMQSLSNQTKKLARLTDTIVHLQSSAGSLQRFLKKIEFFYQINLRQSLKFVHQQWKLNLTDQQLRFFQPNDFILILLCQISSKDVHIEELFSNDQWNFLISEQLTRKTFLCQPILFLRYQNECHYQLGLKQIILPYQCPPIDDLLINKKFQPMNKAFQQYHLALTLRNEAAMNFKKMNFHFTRHLPIGRSQNLVHIECKQQEIKVDTETGLVDSLIVQLIFSSSCLRRLLIVYSNLIEFFPNTKIEEKTFVKQTDLNKVIDLIENLQKKCDGNALDDHWLDLLQIRVYLSMFSLGSNYTVEVY